MPNRKQFIPPETWKIADPRGKELQAELFLESAYPARQDNPPILLKAAVFTSRCHPLFYVRRWAHEGSLDEDKDNLRRMIDELIRTDAWEHGRCYDIDDRVTT